MKSPRVIEGALMRLWYHDDPEVEEITLEVSDYIEWLKDRIKELEQSLLMRKATLLKEMAPPG